MNKWVFYKVYNDERQAKQMAGRLYVHVPSTKVVNTFNGIYEVWYIPRKMESYVS